MIIQTLGMHDLPIAKVAFSPDGNEVVSAGKFHDISFWNVAKTESEPSRTIDIKEGRCNSVCYSPDGKLLASCHDDDHSVRLWIVDSGKLDSVLTGHTAKMAEVDFSSDGELLLSVGGNGTFDDVLVGEAFLWDVRNRSLKARLPGQTQRVSGGAFSPSGRLIATSGWDRNIYLWDRDNLSECFQALVSENRSSTVAFLTENQLFNVLPFEAIELWSLSPSAVPEILKLPQEGSSSDGALEVSVSASAKWFASASFEGYARLWDAERRAIVAELPCDGDVESVAFSPDERHVALAVLDEVLLWDVSKWTKASACK
jgi:WD40 repeat protein